MSEIYFQLHENIVLQSKKQICHGLSPLINPENDLLKAIKYESMDQTHILDR